MQKRHLDRASYFKELYVTSKEFFLPYIRQWHLIAKDTEVLEIGCGEGGNLLPFSEIGCNTVGIDISKGRIEEAEQFYSEVGVKGTFIANDIFEVQGLERSFDIIICHDVIEHIANKRMLLAKLDAFLKPDGVVFMAFPAWQMPFGGHQQICKSVLISHLPFIHLLPRAVYRWVLSIFGENHDTIEELLSIKQTRMTIEQFEKLLNEGNFCIKHKRLWFINPHYKVKFGLRPRKLWPVISAIPVIRNYFSTSCFYILDRISSSQ